MPHFSRDTLVVWWALMLLAASLLSLVSHTQAFSSLLSAPVARSRRGSRLRRVYGMTPRQDGSENGDEDDDERESSSSPQQPFDVDAARRQLELLFSDEKKEASGTVTVTTVQDLLNAVGKNKEEGDEISLPTTLAPPLTAADRERRLAEIQLLRLLEFQDEHVVESLWNLWYGERGAGAAQRLAQSDQLLLGDADSCARVLTDLIHEHGPYFVEPVNRLATLYYLQARYQDSYALCRVVLAVKPWHFGALSGIVQVLLRQNKKEQARYWAERCLPSLSAAVREDGSLSSPSSSSRPNPRRRAWVQRAVQQAEQALREAEARTVELLGPPEDH